MLIVLRNEAKAAGLRHYFTGRPCVNGHIERRRTANKVCLGCHRERRAELRSDDPQRVKAQKAKSYRRNKPKVVAAVRRWQKANPAHRQATQAAYRARRKARQAH